jgi:hypothetical protein
MKKRLSLLISVIYAVSTVLVFGSSASALSGSEFQNGRITDDIIFFRGNTLSIPTIQQFLDSKVPVCDTNGTQLKFDPSQGDTVTRAVYSQRRGVSTPFTCLKDYRADIPAKGFESGLCNGLGASANKTAAEIIYYVSESCGVNSKALLVLLQKEQSLVTDDWPWPIQYRSATGYGCPDTAPCDAEYYGFFNQVYNAARQFKRYVRDSHLFNYKASTNSFVLYNPNSGCGGTNVGMANHATAALYNYTPYQPNAAALNNLYGTGDGCSSYGNRNYWRMFNDWFGTTLAPNFGWYAHGYQIFNPGKTVQYDPGRLSPGELYRARLTATNTGASTWSNTGFNPVLLGAGGSSPLCHSSWMACNRPAVLMESSVGPGQEGHFEFEFRAPYALGTYRENFKPVAEMLAWFKDEPLASFGINVVAPGTFSWNSTGYKIMDKDETFYVDPGQLEPGQQYVAIAEGTNTGSATWKNSGPTPVILGTSGPTTRTSMYCNGTWIACNRPVKLTEATVAPGQTGHFKFTFRAPFSPGVYREAFKPVAEMLSWFNDDFDSEFGVRVVSPGTFRWSTTGYQIWNSGKTVQQDPGNLQPSQTYVAILSATNTGTATWKNSGPTPVVLGTVNPTSSLCGGTWIACNRPAKLTETTVAPGQTGHFEFTFQSPASAGFHRESFRPVAEMLSWFNEYSPYDSFGIRVVP